MIEPPMPSSGMNVLDWSMKVWRFLRATAPKVGPGLQLRETPSGTIISLAPRPPGAATETLQFEISVTPTSLTATPGVFASESIAPAAAESPTDGTWYLEARMTINTTTGAITARTVEWVSEPSSSSSSSVPFLIGEVTVTDGVPDASTIVNYTYGPLLAFVHGTYTDMWGATIF